MELRDPDNSLVPATTSYNPATQTATLTPSAPLPTRRSTRRTVSGAKDAAGQHHDTCHLVVHDGSSAAATTGPGSRAARSRWSPQARTPYSKYLAEILRTEGLNEFTTIDVSTLSASTLAALRRCGARQTSHVTAGQATHAEQLGQWRRQPDRDEARQRRCPALLGITAATGTTSNAYLKVDPATAPGAGIVSDTIQYHGSADRYALSGAQAIATIYSNATHGDRPSRPSHCAMLERNGGQAAAFTFDLARSVVQTRQGNPAWAGQERDGQSPIRSDDMFFGGTAPPTGSTSTRRRSRRQTSSSGCSPT